MMCLDSELRRIYKLSNELLYKLDCVDVDIEVEWNSRFRKRVADAMYNNGRGVMRFSTFFWPHMSEQSRNNTIAHEVCHVACGHLDYHELIYRPHGAYWKSLMRKCGYTPKRTMPLNGKLKKMVTANRIKLQCGCQDGILVTKRMFNIMNREGWVRRCQRCGWKVRDDSRTTV